MEQPDAPLYAPRSDRKRVDQPVQELARRLAELTEDACQALPAPDDLKEELLSAIRTRAHGARNRQIKRVASLLRKREADAEVLRAALAGQQAQHHTAVQGHKSLELLRERLCDPEQVETALAEAGRWFPRLDQNTLQYLARAARAAQGTGDRKPFRALFRFLRGAQEAAQPTGEPGGEE